MNFYVAKSMMLFRGRRVFFSNFPLEKRACSTCPSKGFKTLIQQRLILVTQLVTWLFAAVDCVYPLLLMSEAMSDSEAVSLFLLVKNIFSFGVHFGCSCSLHSAYTILQQIHIFFTTETLWGFLFFVCQFFFKISVLIILPDIFRHWATKHLHYSAELIMSTGNIRIKTKIDFSAFLWCHINTKYLVSTLLILLILAFLFLSWFIVFCPD